MADQDQEAQPEDSGVGWIITENHQVLCTVEYRGVLVSLTEDTEPEEDGTTSIGYRYKLNGEEMDDGLDVDPDPTKDQIVEAWDSLRTLYEDEINELLKLSYPWQEGDKGFLDGEVVTVVGPFDRGYLYVKNAKGERITTLYPAVSPLAPARQHAP